MRVSIFPKKHLGYSIGDVHLNKNAAGLPAAQITEKTNYLRATGAIRGSPEKSKPRTPIHNKMLPDRSYLIVSDYSIKFNQGV
jgi:hypothetical protein